MNRQYRKWWSPALGRDMELFVFGDGGTPVLVFPTSMGRFYQWEDFGMVAHMAERIEQGWLQLWCVDSVDSESFYDKKKAPQERAQRPRPQLEGLAGLEETVVERLPALALAEQIGQPREVAVVVAARVERHLHQRPALVAGRHRQGAVGEAGLPLLADELERAQPRQVVRDAGLGDPLHYSGRTQGLLAFLPYLDDERYLAPLRATEIVIASGHDDRNVDDSRRLAAILQEKGVPASLHIWDGWAHDWPYWKEMVDVFL